MNKEGEMYQGVAIVKDIGGQCPVFYKPDIGKYDSDVIAGYVPDGRKILRSIFLDNPVTFEEINNVAEDLSHKK